MRYFAKIAIAVVMMVGAMILVLGLYYRLNNASEAQAGTEPSEFSLRRSPGKEGEQGFPRMKVKQMYESEIERVRQIQVMEGIDIRMRETDLNKPPPGVSDKPFEKSLPFSYHRRPATEDERRRLADHNELTEPGIIAFDQQENTTQQYYAYRYIFNNLKKYSTQFVMYPYAFNYVTDASHPDQITTMDQGGVFTLSPDGLPTDSSSYNYFKSFKAATDVSFGKAKALYDVNVAVLKVEEYMDGIYKELTYEGTQYCNLMATYLGKYTDCMSTKQFDAFQGDPKNSGKQAFVFLNATDINADGYLFYPDGTPRWEMLIIPDYYTGAESIILDKLGAIGQAKIKEFMQKGGFVFASGKGGYLLEKMGVLQSGMYNPNYLLSSLDVNLVQPLEGCEQSFANDFLKKLLCMNVLQGTKGEDPARTFALSTYLVDKTKLGTLEVIQWYNKNSVNLRKKDMDGYTHDLTGNELNSLPCTMLGTYGKGRIYLMNANPLFKSTYNTHIYNVMLLAMSKNVMFDAYVGSKDNKPIPGGEAGIQLNIKMTFMNLYDTSVSNVGLHVWLVNNLEMVEMPSSCVLNTTNMSSVANMNGLNYTSHYRCGCATMGAFEKLEVLMSIEIKDQSVTQAMTGILIARPYIEYVDDETGVNHAYESYSLTTSASLAALLRANLNPDPSSFYPVKGRGQYVDNVLQVENKEDTLALDVEYTGLVPIVSPLVDGSDQTAVVRICRFLPSYYDNEYWKLYYPFEKVEGRNYDYVDLPWLSGKNVILDAEWDIPVKSGKELRNDSFPPLTTENELDVQNSDYGTNVNSKTVLKQVYYIDADKFFEHATFRLMVFVDTSKPAGAATRYPDGIPAEEQNPNNPAVAKKELVWTRSDLYFYDTADYQKPENVAFNKVITLDRYTPYPGACVNGFGNAKATKIVEGYFSIDQPGGLKANEYSNELLMHCEREKVMLSEIAALSNGSIVPIHYLVPVTDTEIQKASDIMDFDYNVDGTGHLHDYEEVKFIYGHYFQTYVDASYTRQGGRIEIVLPENMTFINESVTDPIESGYVTYSADKVAFYETTYDNATRTIVGKFKRGLMPNEAYGKPSFLGIMFEELNSTSDISVTMKIYELKYDISAPELNFEKYIKREDKPITLLYDRFYSLPAVQVKVKVNRGGDTSIFPYELMEPYTRFGVYIQELLKHRTVWGSAESHHVSDPGIQAISGGFSLISNLGISSIPFVEYLTTGKALLIPSGPSTSRIEWKDIWGRKWTQPLRSVFPDVPPIPPPLRNFMMTTTFEVTKAGSTTRVFTWNSDESLDIRVQIKLLNNYPKYFQVTTCKDNEVAYYKTKATLERQRIFEAPPYEYQVNTTSDDKQHIAFGSRSVYGMCFDEEGTVLKGSTVSSEQRAQIAVAHLCSETLNQTAMLECSEQLSDLPTVQRRPSGNTIPVWMYSPEVERYYPVNYIKSNMWDLTHYDYDDTPMDKAYKYHMDNTLPGLDLGPNPPSLRPHNVIAQPIWKGFGYSITYDKNKSLKRFPQYKGWWSDNLQNKDHTLLAGQTNSNDVSVDKATLLPDSAWVNANEVENTVNNNILRERLKNIHTCLYNQHRVRLTATQQRFAYLANVYQNNIIPIIPELERDDPRLTSYNCDGVTQYTPATISQVDNIVETPTIRDWLYFSANLRGNARETINVPYSLSPISKIEGMAKVADGGRFVYWNPANGPNSFLIVDNPVNVIEAKRNDLSIACEVLPQITTTFNAIVYNVLKVSDPAEVNRQWKFLTYTNHYGFGDSTVSIFVGGTQATKSVVNAGEYTMVKITFYNNAGFDWNMKTKAINFEFQGYEAINADDLLKGIKHAIQKPLSYNFLKYHIPAELEGYLTITPSDHNLDVAPQFFDFMNINVVTIRDGFKGDYYLKLTLADTIPDSIRGKVYDINVTINETCFDQLPGYNDPTEAGYHDYQLQVPPIKIGIPYASGANAGKVFYTSGYSTNLKITAKVPEEWNITGVKLISEEQLDSMRIASGDLENYRSQMLAAWNTFSSTPVVPLTEVLEKYNGQMVKSITLDMTTAFPKFPLPNGTNPDIAKFLAVVKCERAQLKHGTISVIYSPRIYYNDFTGKAKSDIIPEPLEKTVTAKGAWLEVAYTSTLLSLNMSSGFSPLEDQRLFKKDINGVMRIDVKLRNTGTDTAYYVNITLRVIDQVLILKEYMQFDNYEILDKDGDKLLQMNTNRSFAAGDSHAEYFILKFSIIGARRLLTTTSYFTVVKSVSAAIDLSPTAGSVQVGQSISTPLKLSVIEDDREAVSMTVATQFINSNTVFVLNGEAVPDKTSSGKDVRYKFYRQIMAIQCENDPASSTTGDCASLNMEEVVVQNAGTSTTAQDLPIPTGFTGLVRSARFKFRVETYDEKMSLLAACYWEGVTERPTTDPATTEITPTPSNTDPNDQDRNYDDPNDQDKKKDQKDKNQTDVVKSKEEGGSILPLWAIVLIPTAAFVVILIAAILIYRKYRMVKVISEPNSQEVAIKVEDQVQNIGSAR